jgi:hypothetical protein
MNMSVLYLDGMNYIKDNSDTVHIEKDDMKELDEIKEYWEKKFPRILVILSFNENTDKYYGMIRGDIASVDLAAASIGELISKGEHFLRTLK